jgi:hypothetical protein
MAGAGEAQGKFQYKAGQYIFVCIPEIAKLEFHPFSLSSAPYEDEVCISIRDLGDWTSKLYELAEGAGADGKEVSCAKIQESIVIPVMYTRLNALDLTARLIPFNSAAPERLRSLPLATIRATRCPGAHALIEPVYRVASLAWS